MVGVRERAGSTPRNKEAGAARGPAVLLGVDNTRPLMVTRTAIQPRYRRSRPSGSGHFSRTPPGEVVVRPCCPSVAGESLASTLSRREGAPTPREESDGERRATASAVRMPPPRGGSEAVSVGCTPGADARWGFLQRYCRLISVGHHQPLVALGMTTIYPKALGLPVARYYYFRLTFCFAITATLFPEMTPRPCHSRHITNANW